VTGDDGRPPIWSRSTVRELWTDPHRATQMLRFHLDPTTDLASRRPAFIDASVAWMVERFGVGQGTRVLDLGCGPGLYTNRLAATGATVTGVDWSESSLAHARTEADRAGLAVRYEAADYLAWEATDRFDLVLLIFCDLCALAPEARGRLLRKVGGWLAPGGAFLLDVHSLVTFASLPEVHEVAPDLFGGFFAAEPYTGELRRFRFEAEHVTLDRYRITTVAGTTEILNWLQHYTPEALVAELAAAGLEVEALFADVAGAPLHPDSRDLAAIARVAQGGFVAAVHEGMAEIDAGLDIELAEVKGRLGVS
jgi:SAM-dependent methyltransferase